MSAGPSNMTNFTENSYNLTVRPASWCVKPGSIYTNPQANFNYFPLGGRSKVKTQCGDPYTYYAYWYRRFPDQTKYLNCYTLPYRSPYFKNTYGYVNANLKQCQAVNNKFNVDDRGFKYFDRIPNSTTNVLNVR